MQLRTVGPQRFGNGFDVGHLTHESKGCRMIMIPFVHSKNLSGNGEVRRGQGCAACAPCAAQA
eukprot:4464886-Amphidinium_carterae.1